MDCICTIIYIWTKYLSFYISITLEIRDISRSCYSISSMSLSKLLIFFLNLICFKWSFHVFCIVISKWYFNIFYETLISYIFNFLIWSIHRKSKLSLLMEIDKFWLLKWIDVNIYIYSFGCENYIKFVSMEVKIFDFREEKKMMKDA